MALSRRQILAGIAAAPIIPYGASAQTGSFPPLPPEGKQVPTGSPMSAPPRGFYPYSGVSGPGSPAEAYSERGGWISGPTGLRYEGPNPPPYKTLP